jgi:protein TonB
MEQSQQLRVVMKQKTGFNTNRDMATALTTALVLHSIVLYGLWSYRVIPPPSEPLTVFVRIIDPASPARTAEPTMPKAARPEPVRQEAPKTVPPVAAPVLKSTAPVASPVEPVAPPVSAAKPIPAQAPIHAPVAARAATVSPPNSGGTAGAQPVLITGELSVSCTERTAPAYPKQSLRLREQGKTVLLVELDEKGRVVNADVKTASGFPRLDEAAINAVKSWHCNPAQRNGVTVRSFAVQPFNFTLKGR